MLLQILNVLGIGVFAASGALVGIRRDFDIWGIATVAVLTGVGGGILRDVLLGITPPSALDNWVPVTVALISALVTVVFHPSFALLRRTIVFLDAIGMGLFAATGASIAIDHHTRAFAATLIGMLAAIGGGVLRDVLANEVPLLLQPADLYAVPALVAAAVVAVGRTYTDLPSQVWVITGLIVGALLRLVSLVLGWRLPMAPRGVGYRWRRGE
ncbi:trimeric intracellular cation channel family protein [Gordonia otitidis]|uniref:Glycine transporter domain-containing protein n=1 Tax=Gordonia otitidis (strain DSM 44809 / CCUG 52243 / JCM 12355 / NBRC 100426 / IFM 10032) TaxID=1108044 RepID=H5TPV6_GORO1|nr:trimeric intracellular cation channel family protein [Gordonia otitidis]UEA59992.1 trimeric intracellular cation channel family protein [Gordonia otitidis]GAB35514.1 hypothetical protein GOOTI_169_00120 [Gordonia otitidis NBRC 100426]